MELLDSIIIANKNGERRIELCRGDLTAMTPEESVDVLIVSAFPNDYYPLASTLIGALHKKGISVEMLSRAKEVDLREAFSCWLSRKITSSDPGIQFKRIVIGKQ